MYLNSVIILNFNNPSIVFYAAFYASKRSNSPTFQILREHLSAVFNIVKLITFLFIYDCIMCKGFMQLI